MWDLIKRIRVFVVYKIFKLKTVGVRIAIVDDTSSVPKVLLVGHPYDNQWVFPGGGVSKNENIKIAAIREVKEEVSIKVNNISKFGEYKNTTGGKNDTVHLFITRDWEKITEKRNLIDRLEVSRIKWFSIDELPDHISRATKDRIREIFDDKKMKNLSW